MKNITLFLLAIILFASCSQKKHQVPDEVLQFSEEAISASVNTYPVKDFIDRYFDSNVPQEYTRRINANMIIWRGMEHNITLRNAHELKQQLRGEQEYLLNYWVKFKDKREFSYLVQITEKEGKMALKRFEPMNINVGSSFYAPNASFHLPDYSMNQNKIYATYLFLIATLITILILALRKKTYRWLLLTIPLIAVNKLQITQYFYNKVSFSNNLNIGFPLLGDIDLYFSAISILPIGTLCVWGIIVIFAARRFLVKVIKSNNNQLATNS